MDYEGLIDDNRVLISLIACSMNYETAVAFTYGHFNKVVFAVHACSKLHQQQLLSWWLSGSVYLSVLHAKSTDHTSPSNYRPISLLAILSKVLEKCSNNSTFHHAVGFCSSHSTTSALATVINDQPLECVQSCKYLGVTTLSWLDQIQSICNESRTLWAYFIINSIPQHRV